MASSYVFGGAENKRNWRIKRNPSDRADLSGKTRHIGQNLLNID